jgi:hypothetical protein
VSRIARLRACPERHRRIFAVRTSLAELPEMMVHVEIAPAHPFLLRQLPKHRMRTPLEISWLSGESIQKEEQLRAIRLEFDGRCSAHHLISFGPGLDAVGPGNTRIQSKPLHQHARTRHLAWREMPIAHGTTKGIAQVAHHLVAGHFAPTARGGRLNPFGSFYDLLLVPLIGQCLPRHLVQMVSGSAARQKRRHDVLSGCRNHFPGGAWNRSLTC